LGGRKGIRPVKKPEWWGAGVVICLELGADLHIVQLMPLPLTVSCFSKIQVGFTFLVPAHSGSPRRGPLNGVLLLLLVQLCSQKDKKKSKAFTPRQEFGLKNVQNFQTTC